MILERKCIAWCAGDCTIRSRSLRCPRSLRSTLASNSQDKLDDTTSSQTFFKEYFKTVYLQSGIRRVRLSPSELPDWSEDTIWKFGKLFECDRKVLRKWYWVIRILYYVPPQIYLTWCNFVWSFIADFVLSVFVRSFFRRWNLISESTLSLHVVLK